MPEMRLEDVAGFRVWATMLVNNDETYTFADANAQLSFYRNDDAAYLVVNVFVGEKGIFEYVFLSDCEENKNRTALFIFDFLKTLDFNLHRLLIWLQDTSYIETEMGDEFLIAGLRIRREFNESE